MLYDCPAFTGRWVRWRRVAATGLALAAQLLVAAPALAQVSNNNWLTSTGGSYTDGTNWSAGAPGGFEVFGLDSPGYTVNFTATAEAGGISVVADNPTFNLNGNVIYVFNLGGGLLVNSGSLTLLGPGELTTASDQTTFAIVGQVIVNGATLSEDGLGMTLDLGGSLTVENGGAVLQNDGGGLINGSFSHLVLNDGSFSTESASASIPVDSGMLSNGSSLSSGIDGSISFGNGVIDDSTITAGRAFTGENLTIGNGATIRGGENLNLSGMVNVLSGTMSGVDAIFAPNTTLTVQLHVGMNDVIGAGELDVGGILDFTLPSGFTPAIGEAFQILNFDTLNGTFAGVNLPPLDGGGAWDTSNLYTTGVISVVPEPTILGLAFVSGALLLRRTPRRRNRNPFQPPAALESAEVAEKERNCI